MSRFPKITETFILYEILELQRLGVDVEVFPLLREKEGVMHAEAAPLVERARYCRPISWAVLYSQLYWLITSPRLYARAWWRALQGNAPSPAFFVRALWLVPVAAHFARHMRALKVEHVHACWATHPALAAYVIRILTGIPYSITAHSHEIYVDRTMLEEKIRGSEFLITISEYNRRLLTDLYGDAVAQKTSVVHCGVDTSVFRPTSEYQRSSTFTILCVASLQRHKGHEFLLRACAELRSRGIAFRCVLVGEGEDREHIERLISELELVSEVDVLGRQTRDQVIALMREADVLTIQSVMTPSGMSEGVPVSLMEAMACGVPVIASELRGIPELVEHRRTGLLIPPCDARALAEALVNIHDSPVFARELAIAAREKVLREFDLALNTRVKMQMLIQGSHSPVADVLPTAAVSEAAA